MRDTATTRTTARTTARTASVLDAARVVTRVLLPTLATGVIVRRPLVQALAERGQWDRKSVAALRAVRDHCADGPLALPVPGRNFALVLSPEDVPRLLAGAPEPFAPATTEKDAALRHFQPHGVLVSRGRLRERRRALTEQVLEPNHQLHALAEPFTRVAVTEVERLLRGVTELDWSAFAVAWWRIVRQVVVGAAARDDHQLTDELAALRRAGNWAYLHPQRRDLRDRFTRRLREHLDRGDPESLAAALHGAAAETGGPGLDPAGQVPHWLFAFDAAGIAAFRALALLATHPSQADRARADLAGLDLGRPQQLPRLRASLLESVRLWPTTPLLLRQSTEDTEWRGAVHPAGTTFLVHTPFFHRDPDTLPEADRFAPDLWLDGRAERHPALVPFSAGPAVCPGRNLVLHLTSTVLAALLTERRFALRDAWTGPVPGTLNHFGLRFPTLPG